MSQIPYIVDDLFLRMDPTGIFRVLGGSFPPLDMLYNVELIDEYVNQQVVASDQEVTRNNLKEVQLLYELGEITKDVYEEELKKLTKKLKTAVLIEETNIKRRIDILG